MIFGKHINRYYIKNAPVLILGVLALILVDYFQLRIPELYRMLINGMNGELILVNGEYVPFNPVSYTHLDVYKRQRLFWC